MRIGRSSILSLIILLLASSIGRSQVALPTEVKGQKNKFIAIKLLLTDNKAKVSNAAWIPANENTIDIFPDNLLTDPLSTVIIVSEDGQHKLWAAVCVDGKVLKVSTIVVVGNPSPPTPIPPGPSPIPVPNELTKLVQAAYNQETQANKKEAIQTLIKIYEFASIQAKNNENKTAADLFTKVKNKALENPPGLVLIQKIANDDIALWFPRELAYILNDNDRLVISTNFNKIALALRGIQ